MHGLDRAEAHRFIKALCHKLGIPPPLFEPLGETSYHDGEYEMFKVRLKKKTDAVVAVHEFLHYVIHLIRITENDDSVDDGLEHRFINWLLTDMEVGRNACRKFGGKGKRNL